MNALAARFAAAAEALAGTPFRLHGRDRQHGIDCVGLAILALADCGIAARAPHGYGLRNSTIEHHLRFAALNGFVPVARHVARGDLLLVAPGPAQHHLLIALGDGRFVHAHAGLRQVICDAGLPGAPLLRHWRLHPTH